MRFLAVASFVTLVCSSAAQSPSFEVASVKMAAPPDANGGVLVGAPRGGPGTKDPGQITWSGATLTNLLIAAYEVKRYQIKGPDWLATERYDIVAKVPAGATKEQIPAMWQKLLQERFGMQAHRESKEFPTDELIVAKGGVKLKETTIDPNAPPGQRVTRGPDGGPRLAGAGMMSVAMTGPNGPLVRMMVRALTMEWLAGYLPNLLAHPVLDKTGLTGRYDFDLDYKPDLSGAAFGPPGGPAPESASEPGTDIATALEQQLGLKLVKGKAPLEFIVVDRVEKTPSGN